MSFNAETLLYYIDARLMRADEHLDELRRDVESLAKTNRIGILAELNVDRTEASLYLDFRKPYPFGRWAAIVGDFVHCLRAALDNTVYAIALTKAESFPPPDHHSLAFPIKKPKEDWGKVKWRIRYLPEGAQGIIQSAQPCDGGNELLCLLGAISNTDKHKLAWIAPGTVAGKPSVEFLKPPDGRLLNVRTPSGPIAGNAPAVILKFSEPQTSNPHVDIHLPLTIVVNQAGEWRDVFRTFGEMKQTVESIIDQLRPFIHGLPPAPYTVVG